MTHPAAQFSRHWRIWAVGLITATAIGCGFYNIVDEQLDPDMTLDFSLIWSIDPLAILALYIFSTYLTGNPRINGVEALTMSTLYLLAWGQYAANGYSQRDPNTAAQLHIIIAPILLGLPTLVVGTVMLRHAFKHRIKRRVA
jgi:hypothetical protein